MKVVHQFTHKDVAFALESSDGRMRLPDEWLGALPDNSPWFGGISYLISLVDEERATIDENRVVVPNRILAGDAALMRRPLRLPDPIPFTLHIDNVGGLEDEAFRFDYYWRFQGVRLPSKEQNIPTPTRTGLLLEVGNTRLLVQDPLFSLIEGVETFNANPPGTLDARMAAWAQLRQLVGEEPERLELREYLMRMRVSVASSFTLVIGDTIDQFSPQLVGVLPENDGTPDCEPLRAPLTSQIIRLGLVVFRI